MREVPKVSQPVAIACLVINVLLPGFGTITAACFDEDKIVPKTQIFFGVLQFLTSPFLLLGWAWSIYWGWLIYQESQKQSVPSAHKLK